MRFTGSNGAVTWTYPTTTYAAGRLATGDFTIQLWVNPETLGEAKIIRLNGETCYVGMGADGKLTLVNGSDTYPFGRIRGRFFDLRNHGDRSINTLNQSSSLHDTCSSRGRHQRMGCKKGDRDFE